MVINPLRNIVNKKLELVLTVMPEVCVCFVPGVRVKVTVDLLKLSLEFYTKLLQLLNVLSELEHTHTHTNKTACFYRCTTICVDFT